MNVRAEPLDDSSTTEQRESAANAVRHELERCRYIDEVREDIYLTASVGKIGLAHITTEIDSLTGEHKLRVDPVDIQRFAPDPESSRLYKSNYVTYSPLMDFARIKRLCESLGCPEKADKIEPEKGEPLGTVEPERRTRSDEEIINAPANQFAVDTDGKMKARKAPVNFVWQRDDAVTQEIKRTLDGEVPPEEVGLTCAMCGIEYEPEESVACPMCGSEDATFGIESRMYPYGRLTILCGSQQFYDGPNLDEIDCIFPFAAYHHYRVPGEFHGFSDVDLLKSSQQQMDKNMAQLIDNMRLAVGYLQVPKHEPAWNQVTNEPIQKVPTSIENSNIAKWISPQPINPGLHSTADSMMFADFQRVSGQPDLAVTQGGSAPDSATEVNSRDRTRNTRIGGHVRRFNQCDSDVASIAWQIMVQKYVGPRPFMFSKNGSQFESVILDVSTLPRNIRIRVESDPDSAEKDKNAAQNTALAMNSGQLPFMPDVFLRALGQTESMINEIMNRPEMQLFVQIKQMELLQMAAMMTMGAPPNGATPGQATPTGSASPPSNNSPGGEQ